MDTREVSRCKLGYYIPLIESGLAMFRENSKEAVISRSHGLVEVDC